MYWMKILSRVSDLNCQLLSFAAIMTIYFSLLIKYDLGKNSSCVINVQKIIIVIITHAKPRTQRKMIVKKLNLMILLPLFIYETLCFIIK